ncbi:MAG: PAS domain-containing protein [Huintestinicola sp.]|uniref:PAS domain-containing protein n=1 Tax=Huintestinicola sp. TaxID=2981661 RepID=UPI003F08230B
MEKIDFELIGNILEQIHPGLTIADENGTFVYAGREYLALAGLSPEQIIGKNTTSREINEMFSPCVTSMVFEEKKRITTVQKDARGIENFVTGIPIFDENKRLKMIVCYSSWDVKSTEDLRQRYETLKSENTRLLGEIDRLVRLGNISSSIVRRSRKSAETVSLIRVFSEADCPAYIYGPPGSGRSYTARLIYSEKGAVGSCNCQLLDEETAERELFGSRGIVSSGGYRAVMVKGIDTLSPIMQRTLIKKFREYNVIPIGIADVSLSELRSRRSITSEMFSFFRPYQAEVHSINSCPEDLKCFIEYFLSEFNRKYSRNVKLLPRAMNCLLGHEWKENIDEIRYTAERLVLTAEGDSIDIFDLPKEFTRQSNELFAESGSLKNMLEFYEGEIINQHYSRCHTSVALAERLGISQASAVRKIKKYVRPEGNGTYGN